MTPRLEKNFADWEASVFGYGYGSGEEYVLAALRQFLSLCNGPNGQYDYRVLESEMGPTEAWMMINAMGHAQLIDYGSSPRYAWLSETGQALQRFVLAHDLDDLVRFTQRDEDADHCYPNACNCDGGYVKGRVCVNPFWQKDAARGFLSLNARTEGGSDRE